MGLLNMVSFGEVSPTFHPIFIHFLTERYSFPQFEYLPIKNGALAFRYVLIAGAWATANSKSSFPPFIDESGTANRCVGFKIF